MQQTSAMTAPQSSPPDRSPDRLLGVIVRDQSRQQGFVFIHDQAGQEYFAHKSAFVPTTWFDEVQVGEGVSFKSTETPKGLRAWEITQASAAEATAIAEWGEDRGNR